MLRPPVLLLAVDGTLVKVGAPAEPLSLNVFSLIGARRSYAGSMIGGIALSQEMLTSDVRYRFVLDAATLA